MRYLWFQIIQANTPYPLTLFILFYPFSPLSKTLILGGGGTLSHFLSHSQGDERQVGEGTGGQCRRRSGQPQCESLVGQAPHTPRHQNVAARRATARLSEPARAERARSRLPDALLWSLKFAENLSFRSASVATHTHTSSLLAGCPTRNSHCPCRSVEGAFLEVLQINQAPYIKL